MARTLIPSLAATSLAPHSTITAAYVFALAQSPTHLAALASTSTLYLLSPHTLQSTHTLSTPHCLLSAFTNGTFLTAGSDLTTLTVHDPRAAAAITPFTTAPAPITSLAVSPSGLIAVGTEFIAATASASVLLYDPRSPRKPIRAYRESHSDDVTALSFHQAGKWLVSGATDGLVNLFDYAVGAGIGVEGDDEVEGAVHAVYNHGSVHQCGFLRGHNGDAVWALSHDEVLGVYADEETWSGGDVRRMTGAEYVVNLVDGRWLVAGNKVGGWVDFVEFGERPWGLREEGGYRLMGGHGEDVCRDVVVDAGTNTIFTGGEDGVVRAWRPPVEESAEDEGMETEKQAATREKHEKKEKKKKKEGSSKRYNPY